MSDAVDDSRLDHLCGACGLTFGSHRGDSTCRDQCPEHEGRMDWNMDRITTFVPTGRYAARPTGTPRWFLPEPSCDMVYHRSLGVPTAHCLTHNWHCGGARRSVALAVEEHLASRQSREPT